MKQQILSLGKDSLIYGVGSVITRFIGMFTLPLFTAYLTAREYGILSMLSLLTLVAQPIFSLGLGAAMGPCYFERDSAQNKSSVVWTTFFIHSLSSALLIFIAWSYPAFIAKLVGLSEEKTLLVGLTLTGSAFTVLATAITARVQFEKQSKLYVVVTLITALTAISVSLVTVVFLGWGVKGMVIGQFSGNAITLLAFMLIALRNTRVILSGFVAKELLYSGFPLIPSFAFIFIIMNSNKYILESISGLDSVGIYSIGFSLGMSMSIFTGGFSTAWFPFFLKYIDRQSETLIIFSRLFTYYVFSVGLIVFLYFIFAKLVVTSLINSEYHRSYQVVGFVAIANFSQALFGFFLPGLYYNNEIKYVSIIQGMAALLSLPLNYYLIMHMGALGAGIGLATSNTFMAALMYGWNIINKMRYPHIMYDWGRIFRFLAMLCVFYVVNEYIVSDRLFIQILQSVTICALAFISTCFLLTSSDRRFLLGRCKLLWENQK